MAYEQLTNNAVSQLNGAIDGSTNPITLTVDDASDFPSDGDFHIIIEDEIMVVTSVSGNNLTATRAQESTSIAAHADNTPVQLILTAASITALIKERSWRPYKKFVPSGVDDEFDDSSFSGWTAVGSTPTPTVVEAEDKLSIYHPGGGATSQWYAWMKSATVNPGDWIEMCFRANVISDNYPIIALVMADGATYNSGTQVLLDFSAQENQSFLRRVTGYNTPQSQTGRSINNGTPASHYILRLTYVSANTFKAEMSGDGIQYMQLIGNTSLTLTPSYVGFGVTKWGGTQPALWTLEYFRKGS